MPKRFLLFALFLTLTQSITIASEDTKTRPNKQEIIDMMLQASRLSAQEQSSRLDQILKNQEDSKTPRSDFMFCTGLAYQGNYKAQMCVGAAFEKNLGIVEDMSEAYTWYELALANTIPDQADAQKAEANRDRVKEKLVSAYPHPTEDDLTDLVNAQKTRIAQYQDQIKKK